MSASDAAAASADIVAQPAITRLHAIVRGRVQGVGFRYWMHHSVERFRGKVTGSVRNTEDGNVEVELESADRGLLEALLLEIHEGPRTGHVDAVNTIWETEVEPRYSGAFRVA